MPLPPAPWYEVRRAQSRKPSTYTCPVCGGLIPALVPHALVTPEGDGPRRRHAHLACLAAERAAGRLPSREEARAALRPKRRLATPRTGTERRMNRSVSRQRRMYTGAVFVVAGAVVAAVGTLVPGLIMLVCGLLILALAARGYESLTDARRGRQAYAEDGANVKRTRT